jgi:1,4-alpha-glucan branching enzyme
MAGDFPQQLASLRAYLGWMWGHPGKKLLFMGCEFALRTEWNHDASPTWDLLDDPRHRGVQRLVRDLNRLYRSEPALHELDASPAGFEWLIGDDSDNSVFALIRKSAQRQVLVITNLTPVARHDYRVGLPGKGARWREMLNTDAAVYTGSGMGNSGAVTTQNIPSHGHAVSAVLTLPPLSTLIFTPEY